MLLGASNHSAYAGLVDHAPHLESGEGRSTRPRILPCALTYLAVACLSVMGLQVLGDVWAWSGPVRLWTSVLLGAVALPAGAVALVRSRWRVCGPEVAIVALTLAGLAVGVRLAALLPH